MEKRLFRTLFAVLLLPFVVTTLTFAQTSTFHHAPSSAETLKNPFAGVGEAPEAGKIVFTRVCAKCHGPSGAGSGNVPSLQDGSVQSAPDGAIFWYITNGDLDNGMPSWASIPDTQRWQVITYIKALKSGAAATELSQPATATASAVPPATSAASTAGPPHPPFTDYRFEKPGAVHKIRVEDLPQPYASQSASNGPKIVARPPNMWPQAPAGFKVELYATDLTNPRVIRTAPNGDYFLAETTAGNIKIFRGITADGKPAQVSVFATGLNTPFGIAFYPPGPDPHWVYVANMDSIVRFPYHNGDLTSTAPAQKLADLPAGGHHRSRDIQFSLDGKKMFISIGSHENVSDAPEELNRAAILEYNPDASGLRVYASGLRNAVGIAIQPETGALWCSTNERDGLGNDLVPDYITHVQEGGFYGWPWWYMGGNQDPRMAGKHPELKAKVITPDVLLQPHNASLEMTFYEGTQFPAEYRGDIFASEHGSWNRQPRAGYEVIRVPLHQTGHATGEYEDFLTGFVIDDESVWGRPVGVAVATDGSLLVSDDASGSIWRVSYTGK
jgi:glucose/arabinose dehydrogenase